MLMFSTASLGFISDASAEEFKVLWTVQLPREIYFVGETVSFTVTAYASTDPTLKLPDQMATVTIRNESLAEVYSGWITTNMNGSSPVQWSSGLEAQVGNYTIILKDIPGTTVTKNFMLLFNEEMYWKKRVELIEEEMDRYYEHLNYLFAANKWLTREMNYWKNVVRWTFFLVFAVLLVGLWVFFPELAKRSRQEKGIYKNIAKGLTAFGLTNEPKIYLEHEEVAQVEVPPDKAAPRFNAKNYCPICDPELKNPMTLVQFESHIKMHDKDYLKSDTWSAKFKEWNRKRKLTLEERENADEPLKPAFGSVEDYREKLGAKDRLRELQVRLKVLKDLRRKKKIAPEKLKDELGKIREEMRVLRKENDSPLEEPVYKKTTSQKVVSPPKPPEEKRLSGIPKNRVLRKMPKPTKIVTDDPLDELLDRLKVN